MQVYPNALRRSRTLVSSLLGLVLALPLLLWYSVGLLRPSLAEQYVHVEGVTLETEDNSNHYGAMFTDIATHRLNMSWDEIQAQRRQVMASACDSIASLSRSVTGARRHLLVDWEHRVLYCAIPKVACSSWKLALTKLTGQFRGDNSKESYPIHDASFLASIGIPSLELVGDQGQIRDILANFTKFIVVRHPLERLVSAYRDKFRTYSHWTKYFQFRYGKRIIQLYRDPDNHRGSRDSRLGRDVTFPEFLRFITDERIPADQRLNPHWDTYQSLCRPCHVSYDHVLKFETFNVDTANVLHRYFGVTQPGDFFPKRNSKPVPSGNLTRQFYTYISRDIMDKIYDMYRVDFEMFEYD